MKSVSVVMATYNGEKYLREQLDSILNQTYPIYEIIIQDDCSTDGTIDIVKEYADKYPFIKLYVNEHNLGFNQNFKSAAMKATGDSVAISDQDDVWFPETIEEQVQTIGDHDICFCNYLRGETLEQSVEFDLNYNFERLLFFGNICGHTMLCSRLFIQDTSNWLDSMWYDWSLSLHACLQRGIIKTEKTFVLHRAHEGEVSNKEILKPQKEKNLSPAFPYIYGVRVYRTLQKNSNRKRIYTWLYENTKEEQYQLVHRLCELLLKEDLWSLLRLCILCQKYRKSLYNDDIHGFMGWIRGFFFPMIHACYYSHCYKDFLLSQQREIQ